MDAECIYTLSPSSSFMADQPEPNRMRFDALGTEHERTSDSTASSSEAMRQTARRGDWRQREGRGRVAQITPLPGV